jgi:hypothetical protein
MSVTIVRYRVKPGHVEENARLVRAVYEELAAASPPGFHYATSLLDDGATFVHVAITDGDAAAPLPGLAAFAEFQRGLEERVEEGPAFERSREVVGAYGLGPVVQSMTS